MTYKVIKPFIDSQTNKGFNEGSTFTTDDGERALILVEKGFIEEKNIPSKAVVVTTGEPSFEDLKNKAKELKIKGYTKMDAEQLAGAIEGAQKASD